ncbi:MAG: hypothetical protein MUP90_12935, partial [Gammaproteobacteria bacterium]|nr:hypothetical protein [Gammaproteobacteria bacterium]
ADCPYAPFFETLLVCEVTRLASVLRYNRATAEAYRWAGFSKVEMHMDITLKPRSTNKKGTK